MMADFALINLDGGKNLAMNFSSTSYQVLRILFGCDWSHVFALLANENGKALR